MLRRNKIAPLILFFLLILQIPGIAFSAPSPLAEVRLTVTNLRSIVSNPLFKGQKNEAERNRRIRDEIKARIDFEEMAKRSLGIHWKNRTNAERAEYILIFSHYVEFLYRNMIFESVEFAESADIRFLKERVDGEYSEVDIQVGFSPSDVNMTFKLRLVDGHWKAYDVVVDGISQVLNLRSQFYRIISEHSFDELLRRLRVKK